MSAPCPLAVMDRAEKVHADAMEAARRISHDPGILNDAEDIRKAFERIAAALSGAAEARAAVAELVEVARLAQLFAEGEALPTREQLLARLRAVNAKFGGAS